MAVVDVGGEALVLMASFQFLSRLPTGWPCSRCCEQACMQNRVACIAEVFSVGFGSPEFSEISRHRLDKWQCFGAHVKCAC
jgi:hypothetical protein